VGSKSKNTMSATDMVQLQSSDGVDFSVPRSVASMSVTLDHMLHGASCLFFSNCKDGPN
jgi:hypothetical protein